MTQQYAFSVFQISFFCSFCVFFKGYHFLDQKWNCDLSRFVYLLLCLPVFVTNYILETHHHFCSYFSYKRSSYFVIECVSPWVVQSSGYRFCMISDSTKRYYVDDSRGQYHHHQILFRPLSSTIDYLSTETFQFHVEWSVWDYWKEDFLTMFCYFAPLIRHSVQTMCTMFSRKDFSRLFGGLLRISTRETNAEPWCLSSLDSYNDGATCAAKHLELVHAHHLAKPYTDLTNSIWGTKY